MSVTITEAEIREGDRKKRPPRDAEGNIIVGKVYPGGLSFKEWNEVTDPKG